VLWQSRTISGGDLKSSRPYGCAVLRSGARKRAVSVEEITPPRRLLSMLSGGGGLLPMAFRRKFAFDEVTMARPFRSEGS